MEISRQKNLQVRFLTKHNPSEQAIVCRDPVDCICGEHLSLMEVDEIYGENTSQAWLIPQIANLSEYCGCKGKITDAQIRELAFLIRQTYPWLKTTEMMLFFTWMKSGRFGKVFYGSVDPMTITVSLREFCHERIRFIERQEQEERERKRQKEELLHPPISVEEYLERHGNENPLKFLSGLKLGFENSP